MFSIHIDTARTWRGGQNQVLLVVLGLRARGHRAVLVANQGGELRRRAAEGLDVIPLAPRTEMDLGTAWQLSRVLRRLRPDIVHAHEAHAVAMAALALSMGSPEPRPRLVTSRRVDFRLKKNAFSRWKYRQVDCFLCASSMIQSMLVSDGVPRERTAVVYSGIDVSHVAAAPPLNVHAEFWLPTHAPVIGNVAALVPHKGQRYLIDAAPLVIREIPDARFVIVGQGELESALRKQIRNHRLERHVILAGFRPDVLSLHKGFDVFVMSSVTEGLGTSLLDAMASARPVVATRTGGIPEVVEDGETGLLVPPRNPQALAHAIVRLLRDEPLRQRMAAAGLARVSAHFSADRMVQQTLDVYARLVDRRRAAGTAHLVAGG